MKLPDPPNMHVMSPPIIGAIEEGWKAAGRARGGLQEIRDDSPYIIGEPSGHSQTDGKAVGHRCCRHVSQLGNNRIGEIQVGLGALI